MINTVVHHKAIKIKLIGIELSTYVDFSVENNDKDPSFKVHDHVRISKWKNIFAKSYAPNWSKEVFVIKKVKNTLPWTCIIEGGGEIIELFYEKELQKANQSLELKK